MADLCFLLDDSGSIRDNNPFDGSYDNWDLLLRFVRLVIDQFDIGPNAVQVGVVKFSNESQLVIRLDQYRSKDQLKNAVSRLTYDGGLTNTYSGLQTLRTGCFGPRSGERSDSRNVAVVITDGVPTLNTNLWRAEALRVRREITVFAVGVTNNIDTNTLNTIASNLQNVQTVFSVNDFRGLETVLETLVDETCQPHIPGESSEQRSQYVLCNKDIVIGFSKYRVHLTCLFISTLQKFELLLSRRSIANIGVII